MILTVVFAVVSGQFELQPVNLTLLQGSEAQINATVQGSWAFMTWTVGGLLVVTVPFSGNATSDSPRFSARLCSGDSSCVEFTIHNVTRADSGSVVCFVQGSYGAKTAQLSVQGTNFNKMQVYCSSIEYFLIPNTSTTHFL